MNKLIPLDLKSKDIWLLLASLKSAEIKAGDEQQWDISIKINKLHTYLYKQVFTYEQVND